MRFKFLNIPVQIDPMFWVFLLFFIGVYQSFSIYTLILGGVIFFSLLVHEYGHAITALYFGSYPTITLGAFGGKSSYSRFKMTPKQEFLITLNGPLFESLLIFLPYFLLKQGIFQEHRYMQYFLYATMRINIFWCLLNLIPITPLDGGYLVYYFLKQKFGNKGCKIALIIGLMSALLLIPYLYFKGVFFFGTLLLIFGYQNLQTLRQKRGVSKKPSLFSRYIQGIEAIKNNDLKKAKLQFKPLINCKETQIKYSSIESLAKVYYLENQSEKAYKLLMKIEPQFLKEGKCLLCKIAFEQKNYQLITSYSRDIYKIAPSYETAILNSKSFAYLSQGDLAGGWLKTAAQFKDISKKSIENILNHEAYHFVKDQHIFKTYIQEIFSMKIP